MKKKMKKELKLSVCLQSDIIGVFQESGCFTVTPPFSAPRG